MIPRCKTKRQAWCFIHGKYCSITTTDTTRAGSPCTDHSSYGSQKRFQGSKAKYFYLWVALRRNLKDPPVLNSRE
eukprot:5120461-Alexandrium_andersonii.AAC.1